MNYLVDPKSSFAALSGTTGAIDFLQFPRQTIEFRSGDCDDLAILYAALLEATGVETAFITTPGHIYLAIALELTKEDLRRVFPVNGVSIFIGGNIWLPLEITERRSASSGPGSWAHPSGASMQRKAKPSFIPSGKPGKYSVP
ncbi:MAG: hypothetical protein A3J97_08920 [Spirochaetes bacterium RIFOXYC1_FULL_54_7]|nr:MAG: hypothetical protein A3J97_08920 [Spirochaetes bacterium RIFOXYC1_FULL_54_7]